MKSKNPSKPNRLKWIPYSSYVLIYLLVNISNSIAQGQLLDPLDEVDYERNFVPSYGPNNIEGSYTKRAVGGRSRGTLNNGDLQSNFLDLFDWNKEMPVQDIINTFLDDEEELPILQELSDSCPKRDFFYSQNPSHRSAVMKMKDMFMEQLNAQDAITMAGSLRDKAEVNPNAWLRAVLAAAITRPDMEGLRKPAMIEVMPSMFCNSDAMKDMKRQASLNPASRTCVRLDGSVGAPNGIENRLWYFREDVMLNSHHMYWHLTYPLRRQNPAPDRRGELFAFMHRTFLARYHAERLSNGLAPVLPLNLERGTIIREPYFTKLTDSNSGINWSSRPPNTPLSDTMSNRIAGAATFVSLNNRTIELGRILEAIRLRSVLSRFGEDISISNLGGIDILGNMIEATEYSPNQPFYGYSGIHNTGHLVISLILDPRQQLNLPPGVMGDPATAMRDVIFYPYHTFIDDIFESHKRTLPPYQLTGGDWPLLWRGVEVLDVSIKSFTLPRNNIQTFFNEARYDLARGFDFNRTNVQGPVWGCIQHLDHQDFEYRLTINRKEFVRSSRATIRIYFAPRFDEHGRRYSLEEQRRRFFIMDKFKVDLDFGENTIVRKSADTELTIDFPQSLRELQIGARNPRPYCGCGWPHHLLVPKGSTEGMVYDYFVMVTNGAKDAVPLSGRPQVCRPAPIFCGINGERYPDARPMGYPFDRSIYKNNNVNPLDPAFDEILGPITLEEWISEIPNMGTTQIAVTHTDEVRAQQGLGGIGSNFNDGNYQTLSNPSASDGGFVSAPNFGPSSPEIAASPQLNNPSTFKIGPSSNFFNEFFDNADFGKNKKHPKRFSSHIGISPPSREFLDFIG